VIAKRDPVLNGATDVTAERARTSAAVDAAIAAGNNPGSLAGVPFAKTCSMQGLPTRAGRRSTVACRRRATPL
jgi:Asp-tRNA(Asn)/Glu-tRNA(Gln) amidotransferase A subunit family amidase